MSEEYNNEDYESEVENSAGYDGREDYELADEEAASEGYEDAIEEYMDDCLENGWGYEDDEEAPNGPAHHHHSSSVQASNSTSRNLMLGAAGAALAGAAAKKARAKTRQSNRRAQGAKRQRTGSRPQPAGSEKMGVKDYIHTGYGLIAICSIIILLFKCCDWLTAI